jgi:hypothetical protein
MEALVA